MAARFKGWLPRRRRRDGVAAVKLALILTVFLLLVLGVWELGDDGQMKHTTANSWRGACSGVLSRADGGHDSLSRICPPGGWQVTDKVAGLTNP